MTKRFKVEVVKPNGRKVTESRRVVNFPADIPDDEHEKYVRELWAKYFPDEKYTSITPESDKLPGPPVGTFPDAIPAASAAPTRK